jgi:hypothetical protein
MIPESYQAGGARLYVAYDFPRSWKYIKTLVRGNIVDPSIVEYDGMWWMFAETNPAGHDQLSIFYSHDLMGMWFPHSRSPVIKNDPHFARPGGRIMRIGETMYRFAQDDSPLYGLKVTGFKIDTLTKDEYAETRVGTAAIFEGTGNILQWNGKGMHHVDIHETQDQRFKYVAVVDGWSKKFTLELFKRR